MKDKLFDFVYIALKHFYSLIMWIVYKYKTIVEFKATDKLSPEYKKAIRTYWKPYYRRINIRDFKWYQAKKGSNNVRYIPDVVFHSKIEPFYNSIKFMDAFSNKCYYNMFFQGFNVPYTIAKNINGLYMDDDFHLLTMKDIIALCMNEDKIVIKPALVSGGGRNITFFDMKQKDVTIILENLLKRYGKDFVIQRSVVQHKELSNINSTSLNTVRILSFLYKGEVHILTSVLRLGVQGSFVDNISAGGIAVAIKENGDFQPIGYDFDCNKYDKHPSGFVFKGNKMPAYDKIVEDVKTLHLRFAYFGIIGWDIAINEDSEPVFVEYNLMDTCIRASQLSFGPVFKDLTDEVLDEVFGKKKRLGKK